MTTYGDIYFLMPTQMTRGAVSPSGKMESKFEFSESAQEIVKEIMGDNSFPLLFEVFKTPEGKYERCRLNNVDIDNADEKAKQRCVDAKSILDEIWELIE